MQIKYIDKIISFPPKERNDSISSYFSQAQRFLIKARFDFLDAQQKCRFDFLNITLVHVWMYTIDFLETAQTKNQSFYQSYKLFH